MHRRYTLILVLLVATYGYFPHTDGSIQPTSVAKEVATNTAQLVASAYLVFALATITHELGHAVTAAGLYDQSHFPDVYIGTTNDPSLLLFSLGRIHFYKDYIWTSGRTIYECNTRDIHYTLKQACITAAGGATAAVVLSSLLATITTLCFWNQDHDFSTALKNGLQHIHRPFTAIVNAKKFTPAQKKLLINVTFIATVSLIFNIFYGLTPNPIYPGDGTRLWGEILHVEGKPLEVLKVLSAAGMLGSFALLIKEFYKAHKAIEIT